MKQIKWNLTKGDGIVISAIVKRAVAIFDIKDKQGLEMDITAAHLNGSPIRLRDLFESDDFNFAHDVVGIVNNINRRTGKLDNCFVPRFSR